MQARSKRLTFCPFGWDGQLVYKIFWLGDLFQMVWYTPEIELLQFTWIKSCFLSVSKGKRWCWAATREWHRGQKTVEERRHNWIAAAERQLAAAAEQQLAAAAERQLVAAAVGLCRSSRSVATGLSRNNRSTGPGGISWRLAARLDRRNFLVYQGWMEILLT